MTLPRTLPTITTLSARVDRKEQLAQDVREGLTADPKWLPPKWFYDARGSELFEEITRLPEYYLTRAESEILERLTPGLAEWLRPAELVELGSGSSRKTRMLLEAMHRHRGGRRYAPLDVSADALEGAAAALTASYPWLEFEGFVGDFTADLPRVPREGRRLLAFLGSTIGNLDTGQRAALLRGVAASLRPQDRFLLGVDLVKDPAVLVAAYDDAAGVTAEFNRNMLRVLNRELGAGIPLDAFEHVALWGPEHARIEMRLRALRDLTVRFPTLDLEVHFAEGEQLRTEISCKFTRGQVERELAGAGLLLESWHQDSGNRFACAVAAGPLPAPGRLSRPGAR
jgi:L-histidine N-alpha-methyltransferase